MDETFLNPFRYIDSLSHKIISNKFQKGCNNLITLRYIWMLEG